MNSINHEIFRNSPKRAIKPSLSPRKNTRKDTGESKKIETDTSFDTLDAFRPINQGLGFSTNYKTELFYRPLKVKVQTKWENKKADYLGQRQVSEKTPLETGDISRFYKNTETVSVKKEAPFSVQQDSYYEVHKTEQFYAFAIDTVILALGLAFTFASVFFITTSAFSQTTSSLQGMELFFYSVLSFSCVYLLYFSLMDLTEGGTIGKSILNIKLVNKEGKTPSLWQTLTRSLLNLASMFLLGIPSFFNFQGMLTETKTIYRD